MENCKNCSVRGARNLELRKRLKQAQEQADSYFTALCNVDTTAQAAMEELWTAGGLDCGPEDYDIIVEFGIMAIREFKERHQAPLQRFADYPTFSELLASGTMQPVPGFAGQAWKVDPSHLVKGSVKRAPDAVYICNAKEEFGL